MGVSGILGLAVVFVPSFIVSPGLNQKAFAARSPGAARAAVLGNAAALAIFAFVPALLGMAMRAVEPGLGNPELALPRLTTDVLPPWLGGLALAALFAAELSAADAVLFMLSTSLSRDLYQALLRPKATDAELLKVGRLAILIGGAFGAGLALFMPSVATALRLFYGVMTAALFVPLVVGLLSRRPAASHARLAIAASLAATLVLFFVLHGRPEAEWLPSVGGILAAAVVFATAWLRQQPAREPGASIEPV
jgi:SSS family solute:Na+ symporter